MWQSKRPPYNCGIGSIAFNELSYVEQIRISLEQSETSYQDCQFYLKKVNQSTLPNPIHLLVGFVCRVFTDPIRALFSAFGFGIHKIFNQQSYYLQSLMVIVVVIGIVLAVTNLPQLVVMMYELKYYQRKKFQTEMNRQTQAQNQLWDECNRLKSSITLSHPLYTNAELIHRQTPKHLEQQQQMTNQMLYCDYNRPQCSPEMQMMWIQAAQQHYNPFTAIPKRQSPPSPVHRSNIIYAPFHPISTSTRDDQVVEIITDHVNNIV